jgi:hypothetical protein
VTVDARVVALTHARVIDGTGRSHVEDQTIVIENGSIASVGAASRVVVPAGARVLDLTGRTVIPGIVGLHNHLIYRAGQHRSAMSVSGPRLNLAAGVTTIRTAGFGFPHAELNLKRAIDLGEVPGPRIYVSIGLSGPARASATSNDVVVATPDDVRRQVAYWIGEGVSWFGEGLPTTRELMGVLIEEAHRRGAKVSGHICSVTFREAAALGIDNLEHGLITNTDYIPDKKPDVCPPDNMKRQIEVDVHGDAVRATFRDMLAHHVAMISTLSVWELFVPTRAPFQKRVIEALAPEVVPEYLQLLQNYQNRVGFFVEPELFQKLLQYDREFFRAGGLLAQGADPFGNGALPGFADQRNFELLVEAGFTAAEAVKVMTANGATALGEFDRFGSITEGKRADLVVIDGDLTTHPSDINKVMLVFKDGVGYDSAKLIASVRGQVGIR